jgi:hypothetical protein
VHSGGRRYGLRLFDLDADPVSAGLLGPVKHLVGSFDCRLDAFAAGTKRGDSEACGETHGFAIDFDPFFLESLPHRLGESDRFNSGLTRQQHEKFLAAETGEKIRGLDQTLEDFDRPTEDARTSL